MIISRIAPLFLAALAPLAAADFPLVPSSDRVLTEQQVKDFWLARLDRGEDDASSQQLAEDIRAGLHDIAARLVCLNHNIGAWCRRGNPAAAASDEARLVRLRERLGRLQDLEFRRQALSGKSGAFAKKEALDDEIGRLRARIMG